VQGFDAGADDYVAKPFHLEEVLARIRAGCCAAPRGTPKANSTADRSGSTPAPDASRSTGSSGSAHQPWSTGLLSYLMHHRRAAWLSRSPRLVEHLIDASGLRPRRKQHHRGVRRPALRKKLGVDIIQTVRELGYLLTVFPVDAALMSLALQVVSIRDGLDRTHSPTSPAFALSGLYRRFPPSAVFDRRLGSSISRR